jgi:hypothetical protein
VSEADLKKAIEGRLACQVRLLVVSLCGNEVIIEGVCHLYYHKQLAQHEVMRLCPNMQITNNIQVHPHTYPDHH